MQNFKLLKTLIAPALLLCLAQTAFAQAEKVTNLPTYDNKKVHFGFFIGANYFDFKIDTKENFSNMADFYEITTNVMPGYTIGIVSDLRLNKHFHFRYMPAFAATSRQMYFEATDPLTQERATIFREVESSFIENIFELRFRAKRINNYRWYVTSELKYSLDLASKENVEDDRIFKIKQNDISYGFGIGIDFYFEYFKFSPQLKANWGLVNLHVQDRTYLSQPINAIYTRGVFINLTFE